VIGLVILKPHVEAYYGTCYIPVRSYPCFGRMYVSCQWAKSYPTNSYDQWRTQDFIMRVSTAQRAVLLRPEGPKAGMGFWGPH